MIQLRHVNRWSARNLYTQKYKLKSKHSPVALTSSNLYILYKLQFGAQLALNVTNDYVDCVTFNTPSP